MDDKSSSSRRSADHIHVEKHRRAVWPWILGACGVGLLAVALFAHPSAKQQVSIPPNQMMNQAGGGGGTVGEGKVGTKPISYNGHSWVASGPKLPLPDAQMKAIGKSAAGVTMYGNTQPGMMGGGGGAGVMKTAPMDRPYVRVAPNIYQPLVAVSAQHP